MKKLIPIKARKSLREHDMHDKNNLQNVTLIKLKSRTSEIAWEIPLQNHHLAY